MSWFVSPTKEWSRLVVGKVSPWIDLDTTVTCERRDSEEALAQELGWASHLGLPAVEIALKSLDCANLASHLSPYVSENSNLQVHCKCQAGCLRKALLTNRGFPVCCLVDAYL